MYVSHSVVHVGGTYNYIANLGMHTLGFFPAVVGDYYY